MFKIHGSAKASTVKSALAPEPGYTQSGIIEQIGQAVSKKRGEEEGRPCGHWKIMKS